MIFVLAFLMAGHSAFAQQVVSPCIYTTTNGVTTCVPISTSNPIPGTLVIHN